MKYKFLGDYRLNQVQFDNKSRYNWLFLPGGPGMGSEYLINFVQQIGIPDNLFIADYPGDGSNRNISRIVYDEWKAGLLKILDELKPCILVGHSFGGMFVLTIPELENLVSGLVIISSTPDKGWQEELANTARTYGLPNISNAIAQFYTEPTDHNLELLFYASIPYLFLPHEVIDGEALLKKCSFNTKTRLWADQSFHPIYKHTWSPVKLSTLIISSLDDRLLPGKLFRKNSDFISPNIQIIEFENTGHFPWLSKLEEMKKALSEFYSRLIIV